MSDILQTRIKILKNSEGDTRYQVQEIKNFLWFKRWVNSVEMVCYGGSSEMVFDKLDEAKEYINRLYAIEKREQYENNWEEGEYIRYPE